MTHATRHEHMCVCVCVFLRSGCRSWQQQQQQQPAATTSSSGSSSKETSSGNQRQSRTHLLVAAALGWGGGHAAEGPLEACHGVAREAVGRQRHGRHPDRHPLAAPPPLGHLDLDGPRPHLPRPAAAAAAAAAPRGVENIASLWSGRERKKKGGESAPGAPPNLFGGLAGPERGGGAETRPTQPPLGLKKTTATGDKRRRTLVCTTSPGASLPLGSRSLASS